MFDIINYKFGHSSVEYDNRHYEYSKYCTGDENEDNNKWCTLETKGNICNDLFIGSCLSWIIGLLCLFIISFCGPNSKHIYKINKFECFYKEKGTFGGLCIKQTVVLSIILSACFNLSAILVWSIDNPDNDVAKSSVFCDDCGRGYRARLGSTSWIAMFSFVIYLVFALVLHAGKW